MKKLFKLILVFLVFTSVLVGVQFLGKDDITTVSESAYSSTFEYLGRKFEQEWRPQKGWNAQLFGEHLKEIDKKYKANNIGYDQMKLLTENVCNYALAKTDSSLLSEWSKPLCERNEINRQYAGVVKIDGMQYLTGDQRIATLKRMKNNYDEILKFIDGTLKHPTLGVVANVNDNYAWDMFDVGTYKINIDKKISSYLSLQDYQKYFRKIDYIRENFQNVAELVASAADNYYKEIVTKLLKGFKDKWTSVVEDRSLIALNAFETKLDIAFRSLQLEYPFPSTKDAYNSLRTLNNFMNEKLDAIPDLKRKWEEEAATTVFLN